MHEWGTRVGALPSLPEKIFRYLVFFATCFSYWDLFAAFFFLMAGPFHRVGTFLLLFLHVGGLFCPYGELFKEFSPPKNIPASAHI